MKKSLLFLSFLFFSIVSNLFSQQMVEAPYYKMVSWDSSPYKSFKVTGGYANPFYDMTFRLLPPRNYDASLVSTTSYPLVVMLHGAGESALGNPQFGTFPEGDPRRFNNDRHLYHQGPQYLRAVNEGRWPGFVLFPQNPNGFWTGERWFLEEVMEIIHEVAKKYKIDPNRVYIAGLSAGGHGVWDAISRFTPQFAAALPFSGIGLPTYENTTKVAHIPLWYFQGEVDQSPSLWTADQTIQAMREVGATPKYTVYPETGHDTWNKAISEKDFYSFMLRHSKLSIHASFGKTDFSPEEPVNTTLTISPGFTGYEWRKDDILIPNSNTNQIAATSLGSYTVRFRRGSIWTKWSDPLVLKLKTGSVDADPEPIILTPIAGSFYRGGETITYSGSATDSYGNTLPESAFTWKLDFYKTNKVVPVWTRSGRKEGFFEIPTTGETSTDVFYSLSLTVIDANGNTKTVFRHLPPYTTNITLSAKPVDFQLKLDNSAVATPYNFQAVEGRVRTLGVVDPQTFGGKIYNFSHWVHGGEATQSITVPSEDVTYTAVFVSPQKEVTSEIVTPVEGTLYRGGEIISYSGQASGSDGEVLPPSAFTWKLDFHKPGKIVPIWTKTGSNQGTFNVPTTGETSVDVFYKLTLTVKEVNGGETTISRDIYPYTTNITLATQPAGLQVKLDNATLPTPYTFEAVEGRSRILSVVAEQSIEGKTLIFSHWKHGGTPTQTIKVPANDITYTAVFATESEIPVAEILTPTASKMYRGGEIIRYSGSGKDASGSTVPASKFTWILNFHKPGKIVPVWTRKGSKTGEFTVPTTGETSAEVFYRLTLTVEDANGLRKSVIRDIYPFTSTITLSTQPAGLKIKLDNKSTTTPYSFIAVEGRTRTLEPESPQVFEGNTYIFSHWVHGGSSFQTVSIPQNDFTYTAVFAIENATSARMINELPLEREPDLIIYPNPSVDQISVNLDANEGEKVNLTIINSIGKQVRHKVFVAYQNGVNNFIIDLTGIDKNSYVLKVEKNKKITYKHFARTRSASTSLRSSTRRSA